MEYKVIVAKGFDEYPTRSELEKEVNMYLGEGWKPLGGVSVSRLDFGSSGQVLLAQAMIKE